MRFVWWAERSLKAHFPWCCGASQFWRNEHPLKYLDRNILAFDVWWLSRLLSRCMFKILLVLTKPLTISDLYTLCIMHSAKIHTFDIQLSRWNGDSWSNKDYYSASFQCIALPYCVPSFPLPFLDSNFFRLLCSSLANRHSAHRISWRETVVGTEARQMSCCALYFSHACRCLRK